MDPNQVHNPSQSDEAAAPPLDDQEFDAALGEALGEAPAPADAAARNEPGQAPEYRAAEAPAPAPAAAFEPGAEGNASPQGAASDDIWANAPPEIRTAHEAAMRDMELRYRSANGRVAALQRQLEQRTAPQAVPQQQPAGQDQNGQQPSEQEARLRALAEDYPDLAGPILGELSELRKQLASVSTAAVSFEQQQTQAFVTQQEQVLTQQHPDWQQVASDERFRGWLDTQPRAVREAFARNEQHIIDGQDAALVIGSFKQAVGIGAAPANPAPSPAPVPALPDRRQRQIANGRDAGRGGPAVATGVPDDFETALDYYLAKPSAQR